MLPNTLVSFLLYLFISEQSLLWSTFQKSAIIFLSQLLCLLMHPTMTQYITHVEYDTLDKIELNKGRLHCTCTANAVHMHVCSLPAHTFTQVFSATTTFLQKFSNKFYILWRWAKGGHQGGGFWLMRVTFSSTCHLQLMLLNHHPPLVERWGRNKKWHLPSSPFFFSPPPPLPALLEDTKPLGDKTVQSDSNGGRCCEKCVVIVTPSWLLLFTISIFCVREHALV